MESTPPQPTGPGQRMLAAIVFTDTVNFSARMQKEEVVTLGLLKRDFAVMRRLCEKYSGAVLKTTGDGLLMSFSSAVQAVTCAQKMQRYFGETAKTQPEEETLTHRVGIHLGDVFFHDEDVMGDGVNIAARLQSEADAGGICISQTVYDVVMNKLELEVVKLSHRELKNISQPMPMYRIVLEPQKPVVRLTPKAVVAAPVPAPPVPFALSKAKKLTVFVMVVVVLAVVARFVMQAHAEHEKELARSQATHAALGALLAEKPQPDDQLGNSAGPAVGAASNDPSQAPEYDFAKMTRNQPAEKTGGTEAEVLLRQRATERVQTLFAWMNAGMARYTRDRPLLVRELPGMISNETTIFTGNDHRLYFADGGAIRQRNWTDLKPMTLGAIIVSVFLDAPESPSLEVRQGAEAFAYLHGLPQMNEALHSGHLNGGQK